VPKRGRRGTHEENRINLMTCSHQMGLAACKMPRPRARQCHIVTPALPSKGPVGISGAPATPLSM